MGTEEVVGEVEGWLYLLRSNRIGWQCSKKRYFVLEGNSLRCFRSAPASKQQDSLKSALIDCCIRVTDNGRLNFHRKVFYIFTIYNALDHNDRLKLGASSSEEAAKWISCFKQAAQKECLEQGVTSSSCGRKQWKSFSLSSGRVPHPINYVEFLDWTLKSSAHSDRVSSDVIAPSPWRIFGCHNGLRLFKETKDGSSYSKRFDDHPAIMAVGVVEATPESIFQTLMSLGSSRLEWDFCFLRGRVVESLDGHTDIIHKQLNNDWLPWGMRRRDLLLRRYWRREDDGTYVILYHSVFHRNCLPKKGYVRACLKSGGYVISPVTNGKRSVVKHMLAIDWKFWKSYLFASSAKPITVRMLGRVAALRELFRARTGNFLSSDLSSGELTKEIGSLQSIKENIKEEVQSPERIMRSEDLTEEDRRPSPRKLMNLGGSFIHLNDAADEFFDVQEESEYETPENSWTSEAGMEVYSQDLYHGKLSAAAGFMRKLHGLAVQKKGYVDLLEQSREDSISCIFGTTLPKDPTFTLPCSWAETEPSTFLIRGGSYLQDRQKVKAKNTLMQMVASDWLKSDKREDNLGGRPGSVVQKYAEKGGNEFFFIVNIQVPGSTTYNLVLYYMLSAPVEQFPLLDSFIKGDDAYRNSRFKLIPYISKGSWIVKQSVGKKACLVGQALDINYFQGRNYLELGIDIGSSTVARGVVSLVLGYLNNLVIEMAFLIQANTQEELPEELIGTCRLNHLDASKAIMVIPD